MCPFMPKAIIDNAVYFTYFETARSDQDFEAMLKECIGFYLVRQKEASSALIILLEKSFSIQRLTEFHHIAKVPCIKAGIMIGYMFKDNSAPSLHSEKYFPLRTPTPILILRNLTPQDLIFLAPNQYSLIRKVHFLNSYLNRFSGRRLNNRQADLVYEAKRLRRKYLVKLSARFMSAVALITAFGVFLSLSLR